MNAKEHNTFSMLFLALFVFVMYIISDKIINLYFGFTILIATFIGTNTPDILEPATHWTHRKICHSWNFLYGSLIIFLIFFIISIFFNNGVIYFIAFFSFGYASHLLADSTTKVGLPSY